METELISEDHVRWEDIRGLSWFFIGGEQPCLVAKQLGCKDVGVDCGWSAAADTEEQLMDLIRAHAKDVHGFDPIPDEHLAKIKASIKDVQRFNRNPH